MRTLNSIPLARSPPFLASWLAVNLLPNPCRLMPMQKRPLHNVVATPGAITGEIVVKFRDEALARLDASGNLSFNGPPRWPACYSSSLRTT